MNLNLINKNILLLLLLLLFQLIECNTQQELINMANKNLINNSLSDESIIYNNQAIELLNLLNRIKSSAAINSTQKTLISKIFKKVTNISKITNTYSNQDFLTLTTRINSIITNNKNIENNNINSVGYFKNIKLNRINVSRLLLQNKSQIECLQCNEIKNKTECNQFDDYDMIQLVNILCCECNPLKY